MNVLDFIDMCIDIFQVEIYDIELEEVVFSGYSNEISDLDDESIPYADVDSFDPPSTSLLTINIAR